MDIKTLMDYLSNNIFSIVMCIGLLWCWREDNERHRDEIATITSEHKDESKELREVVQNNTLVIQKLLDKMEG